MRVFLQHTETRLYYAEFNRRVSAPSRALDFASIPTATKFALEQKLTRMEIVLNWHTEPDCEVRLPVLPEWCLLDEKELLPAAELVPAGSRR
jgi:hypothetical protein